VDSPELISVVSLAGALTALCYASILDVRTRKVPNMFWISLSLLGSVLIPIRILVDGESLKYAFILVPIGAILLDVYHEAEGGSLFARILPALKYGIALASTVVLGALWIDDGYFQPLLAVPILMMIFVLMYIFDIVKGGADAKALMALAVLFPTVPAIGELPLVSPQDPIANTLFPFALAVLTDAAFLVVFLPVLFLLRNLAARDVKFPHMLLGYRIDTRLERPGFVWLMERMEDGKHRFSTRPKGDEDIVQELRKLREHGVPRAWVTPKIPFILPILAGLVLAAVGGNILFLLFGL
jgi:preflagellin peptidase FlaK